jgi:hypothetical protein
MTTLTSQISFTHTDGTIRTTEIIKINYTSAELIGKVRWVTGPKLQQLWLITVWKDSVAIDVYEEWRDVPVEEVWRTTGIPTEEE